MIHQFTNNNLKPEKPEWLKVGCFVKTCGWCGEVIEIAESDRAIYVRIFGAKSVYYNNVGGDFVEFNPELVKQATKEEVLNNYDPYLVLNRNKNEQLELMFLQQELH